MVKDTGAKKKKKKGGGGGGGRKKEREKREKGQDRAIVNQTNIGIVSKATLGKLLGDGVEPIYGHFRAHR